MPQETIISDKRVIASQVSAALVKNLLLLIGGMSIAHTIITIPALINDPTFFINKEETSWIGSTNFITLFVGASLSGIMTQKLGRRRSMQLLTVPLFACWINTTFATHTWQIFVSVVGFGFTIGLIEAPIMAYVAEITQPHVRGVLASLNSISVTSGVLLEFGFGTFLSWRNAAAVSSVVPLITFLFLLFVPESPHWLIMHNRLPQAQKSLAWLRGWTSMEMVKIEFDQMCCEHEVQDKTEDSNEKRLKLHLGNSKKFFRKNFCWPFSIVFLVCFVSVFSGCLTLQTYAVNVFATFQIPINQYYATFILGFAQLLGCVVFIMLLRSQGKRVLCFVSLCGCAILLFGLGCYSYINNNNYILFRNANKFVSSTDNVNWIPLVIFLMISFFFNSGIKSLPWVLISEVYSHETRAVGCGLSGAILAGSIFISNKTFWILTDWLTLPVVLFIYSSINLIGLISLYVLMPETEGKSLQEITNHFSGISKLDNKVKVRVNV